MRYRADGGAKAGRRAGECPARGVRDRSDRVHRLDGRELTVRVFAAACQVTRRSMVATGETTTAKPRIASTRIRSGRPKTESRSPRSLKFLSPRQPMDSIQPSFRRPYRPVADSLRWPARIEPGFEGGSGRLGRQA